MNVATRTPKFFGLGDIDSLPQLQRFSERERFDMKVVAQVLPFRVNNYVVEELIDWDAVPDDPIFQLTFPQRGMLSDDHFERMARALKKADPPDIRQTLHAVHEELNPHPAGQVTANVPTLDGEVIPGIQHKYRETCLIFPSSGQTCHSYCTFCFRWPQFVGRKSLRFATDQSRRFQAYIASHKELTDVLITGGDPMIMSADNLESYIVPLLSPEFEHIRTIRIGTKATTYWPHRFVTDPDADQISRLFERVVATGKHLAIMGHYNHWQELSTNIARESIRRIRRTGAQIRTQSPVLRHINDQSEIWKKMWQMQVELGCVPYYMFIERDTGSKTHFEMPLARAYEIFRGAYQHVSGLARTVRGPSMSALPGKVVIDGIAEIGQEKVFVLHFIQGRVPGWSNRPFFAQYDPDATWLSGLKPAFGAPAFFYEDELSVLLKDRERPTEL